MHGLQSAGFPGVYMGCLCLVVWYPYLLEHTPLALSLYWDFPKLGEDPFGGPHRKITKFWKAPYLRKLKYLLLAVIPAVYSLYMVPCGTYINTWGSSTLELLKPRLVECSTSAFQTPVLPKPVTNTCLRRSSL